MKYCTRCGASSCDDAAFCSQCGSAWPPVRRDRGPTRFGARDSSGPDIPRPDLFGEKKEPPRAQRARFVLFPVCPDRLRPAAGQSGAAGRG
jgi:hypothetical protein